MVKKSFAKFKIVAERLKTDKKRFALFILALPFIFIGSAFFALKFLPSTPCDSPEYLLMSFAFHERGTPEIRQADIQKVLDYHDARVSNYAPIHRIRAIELSDDIKKPMFYFRGKDNAFYSYHFWLYSLINLPSLSLLLLFKLPMIYSFFLTNVLLLWLATGCIIYSRFDFWEKLAFLVVFYFGSAFYYVQWAHPEIFTASLFLISLLQMKEGKYWLSGLCAALAAQQNPPVGILVGLVCFLDYWQKNIKIKKILPNIRFILTWSLIGLILLLSPLFFLWKFGVLSQIESAGWMATKYISFYRILAIFFEPNEGMILAIPGVFLLLFILFFYNLAYFKKCKIEFLVAILFLILAVLLALPSSSNITMNSACTIVLRYAAWTMIPVCFALFEMMKGIPWRRTIFSLLIVTQISVFFAWKSNIYGQHEFSPIGKFIFEKFPAFYNPLPELFASRGIERYIPILTMPKQYQTSNPYLESFSEDIYFYVHMGKIRKILFYEADEEGLNSFKSDFLASDISGMKPVICEKGWRYLNCETFPKMVLQDGFYSLSALSAAPVLPWNERYYAATSEIFAKGWDYPNYSSYWSCDGNCVLSFRLAAKSDVSANMTLYGEPIQGQRFIIQLNGKIVFDGFSKNEDSLSFFIPEGLMYFDGRNNILNLKHVTANTGTRRAWHEFACRGLLLETVEKSIVDRQADASF